MQFVSASELEEKVKSARLDLERQQAAYAFNTDASQRSRNRNHRLFPVSTTPYGKDMTVARLFTSSPPSDTFTITNDVVDVDGSQTRRRSRLPPQHPASSVSQQQQQQQRQVKVQHVPAQNKTTRDNPNPNPNPNHRGGAGAHFRSRPMNKEPLTFGYKPVEKEESDGGEKGEKEPSGLSTMIRLKQGSGGKGMSGPGLSHMVYLPDLSSFQLEIPMKFTVEETIYAILERHIEISVKQLKAPTLHLNSKCFELRLHEGDGLPDEDFPALDRSRVITNFCHLPAGGEFCLCAMPQPQGTPMPRDPSLVARLSELQSIALRKSKQEKVNEDDLHVDKLADALQLAEESEKSVTLRITIPETNAYTIVPVEEGMKAYNILDKVQKKQRLPVYSEEYQFLISEKDRNRLSLLSCVIDMDTDIYKDLHAKGIRQIELKRRKFADTPAPPEVEFEEKNMPQLNQRGLYRRRNDSVLDKVAHERNSLIQEEEADVFEAGRVERPQPEKVLFNDLTAAVYQEWDVIKTNKWSKRQKRVMGIDSQKVYNKSRKEGGLRTVKRAERLITDVLAIERVPDKPSCFRVKWRDAGGAESCVLEYEAEGGPTAAAEIIGKIKYIKTHAT